VRCFSQYCYDPSNPPSAHELPGRKYTYSNPDSEGVTKVAAFLSKDKNGIIGGVVALVLVIAGGIAFIFWWRKHREHKRRYSRVDELREDDEPWRYYESDQSAGYEMHRLASS